MLIVAKPDCSRGPSQRKPSVDSNLSRQSTPKIMPPDAPEWVVCLCRDLALTEAQSRDLAEQHEELRRAMVRSNKRLRGLAGGFQAVRSGLQAISNGTNYDTLVNPR